MKRRKAIFDFFFFLMTLICKGCLSYFVCTVLKGNFKKIDFIMIWKNWTQFLELFLIEYFEKNLGKY